jgi:hypothetical protein
MAEKPERFWRSASQALARRINIGWWLEGWTAWLMVGAIFGAIAVLLVRWTAIVSLGVVWLSLAVFALAGALVAWFAVRRRFESSATAQVRLEDALGMKTRLTAAAAGIGPWPHPIEHIAWPVKWRLEKLLGVLAFAALMLSLASWIPIAQREIAKPRIIEKPSAVKDVEKWLEAVRKENAADGKSLEETEKKIAELLKRPSENWYEHGSLEAAGNLKDQTADQFREMSQNLAEAERAASALQSAGDALPQAAKDALSKTLQSAAQSLQSGGMKPNEQLLQQLAQMGAKDLQNLSKEQMKSLAEQLKQNSQKLAEALKNSPELKLAECAGCKPGDKEGDKPGPGGKGGGNKSAPLSMKQDETNLETKKSEAVASQLDLQRLAPGDVMQVTDGKHEVNKSEDGMKQGGAIQNTGDGGAAVWQNSLMPAEREALKRYFK